MLAVGHTAIGIAVGLAVREPAAAFALGMLSHHAADAVPHFDPGSFLLHEPWRPRGAGEYQRRDWLIVGVDAVLTLMLLFGLVQVIPAERWLAVLAAVFGAIFPDLVHNVPFWGPHLRKIGWIRWWQDAIHRRFQWTVPTRQWVLGTITQLATIAFVVWYVIAHMEKI